MCGHDVFQFFGPDATRISASFFLRVVLYWAITLEYRLPKDMAGLWVLYQLHKSRPFIWIAFYFVIKKIILVVNKKQDTAHLAVSKKFYPIGMGCY